MIVFWILCCLFYQVYGIQYTDMLFSIEPIDVDSLTFNESWIVNYDDSLMERIELPVIFQLSVDCSLSFPFMIKRCGMCGSLRMDICQSLQRRVAEVILSVIPVGSIQRSTTLSSRPI